MLETLFLEDLDGDLHLPVETIPRFFRPQPDHQRPDSGDKGHEVGQASSGLAS
jgi:hypothetical protein